MGTEALIPHPEFPPSGVRGVIARIVSAGEDWLSLRWRIEGCENLVVPPFAGRGRADGLWQTTCFEMFIRPDDSGGYCEFNLSPSERWAAYEFTSYREGMTERAMPREPVCTLRKGTKLAIFDTAIPAAGLPPLPWRYALSAVLEEEGGHKSYWAFAHGEGKPDFHDPTCFTGELPAPGSP